jgi:uncharacterized protein (DUF934 family)
MPLFKNNAFVDDTWQAASPEPASQPGGIILNLAEWRSRKAELAGSNQPIGIRIEPGEAIDEILPDLSRFALIALSFPKFNDGRSFSKAKMLREDHRFAGEIRAVGEVLWDQLQLMARCGFDAYEITNEPTLEALRSGKTPVMTLFYQPGLGPETREGAPRAWARRAVAP